VVIDFSKKCSETKLQVFYFYLPKEKFFCAEILWIKNDSDVWQYLCILTILSLVNNNKMKRQAHLTLKHLQSVMTVISSNISLRTEILSQSKWCQVSSLATQKLR